MAYKRRISEINVTPFVDIMLVLLVIFMVTAPLLQQGVEVVLPKANAGSIKTEEQSVVVSITKEGDLFLNRYEMDLNSLAGRLEQIVDKEPEREVYLRADKSLTYGFVVRVIARIRESGVKNLGMITEPEKVRIGK